MPPGSKVAGSFLSEGGPTIGGVAVNTVTTNVPGPSFPLYCLGREMKSVRPYVPITHGMRVGTASVDLLLRRHDDDVSINVLRREGDVEVRMVK